MTDNELLVAIKKALHFLCFVVSAMAVLLPWIIKLGVESAREEASKKDKDSKDDG